MRKHGAWALAERNLGKRRYNQRVLREERE
jgi:hypothetical protein